MNLGHALTAPKTYATIANVEKALAKSGDLNNGVAYAIVQDPAGRFFPVFFPTESQMSETGIHWRWNIFRP